MTSPEDKTKVFVRLLREHDRQLAIYVHSIVPSWADADDIVQETSIRLWEQFDRFEPGSNFGAWSCTVARYLVMAHREKAGRDRLYFSPEVIDRIAKEVDRSDLTSDIRMEELPKCISELSETNRQLLALCYENDLQIKEVAQVLKRTANATYLAVSRVRRWLHDCVQRRLRQKQLGQT